MQAGRVRIPYRLLDGSPARAIASGRLSRQAKGPVDTVQVR